MEAVGVIVDDDLPVITVKAERAQITEGEAARFVLTRVGYPDAELSVPVRWNPPGGGAAQNLTVTIPASVNTAGLSFSTTDDDEAATSLQQQYGRLEVRTQPDTFLRGDPHRAEVFVRDDEGSHTLDHRRR